MENTETFFKKWIDRFLIFDFFILIFGTIWFLFAGVFYIKGSNILLDTFYKFWFPLFLPAITIFIVGILINVLMNSLRQEELD